MSIEKTSQLGTINVSHDAIASLAGGVVSECPGVVGMASQNMLKDGLAELLGKENYRKGIIVKEGTDGLDIELYIIVVFGVRITEVVKEVQAKVKYILEKSLDIQLSSINVTVQGVRVIG